MVGSAGSCEQVEVNSQLFPGIKESLVIFGSYFLWSLALLFSANGYRGTVLVAAGDHQHLIAFGVVVAGKDVCRQVGTGYVPQVQGTISVRPGYTDKDSLHQGLTVADILSLFCWKRYGREAWMGSETRPVIIWKTESILGQSELLQAAGGVMACMTNKKGGHLYPPSLTHAMGC